MKGHGPQSTRPQTLPVSPHIKTQTISHVHPLSYQLNQTVAMAIKLSAPCCAVSCPGGQVTGVCGITCRLTTRHLLPSVHCLIRHSVLAVSFPTSQAQAPRCEARMLDRPRLSQYYDRQNMGGVVIKCSPSTRLDPIKHQPTPTHPRPPQTHTVLQKPESLFL